MGLVKRYVTYLELINDVRVIRPCEARCLVSKSHQAIMAELARLRKFRVVEKKKVSRLRVNRPLQPSNIITKIETDDGVIIELNPPLVFDVVVEDG